MKTSVFNNFIFNQILIIYNDPSFQNIDGNNYYLRSYYALKKDYNYSLADFFAQNLCDIIYCNPNNTDMVGSYAIRNFNVNSTLTRISYSKNFQYFDSYLTNSDGFNYKSRYFTQQDGYKVYGLNLNFTSWISDEYRRHYVRIGAAFNNEIDMRSIDVSGGIGINSQYGSGNIADCCNSSGPGPGRWYGQSRNVSVTPYPFLLFVRYVPPTTTN
jgi:hypothetical protein